MDVTLLISLHKTTNDITPLVANQASFIGPVFKANRHLVLARLYGKVHVDPGFPEQEVHGPAALETKAVLADGARHLTREAGKARN